MTNKRTDNGLSLLVERFERYGLVEGFGVLRFAQDDSKNENGKSNCQDLAGRRLSSHPSQKTRWMGHPGFLGSDGEVQGSGALFMW
jgi:hypothetical protein